MDYSKEFEKFAIKDQGINSTYYNKIISKNLSTKHFQMMQVVQY